MNFGYYLRLAPEDPEVPVVSVEDPVVPEFVSDDDFLFLFFFFFVRLRVPVPL